MKGRNEGKKNAQKINQKSNFFTLLFTFFRGARMEMWGRMHKRDRRKGNACLSLFEPLPFLKLLFICSFSNSPKRGQCRCIGKRGWAGRHVRCLEPIFLNHNIYHGGQLHIPRDVPSFVNASSLKKGGEKERQ